MMAWTQVHISNLPSGWQQEDVETVLASMMADHHAGSGWAGEGSTIMKETRSGDIFCFASFYSNEGAAAAVELLNEKGDWKAALSTNNGKKNKKKVAKPSTGEDHRDLRLRRQRGKPAPKHPVQNSSAPTKKK
mmetsp:Transcript_30652/g.73520  ORF Transcript_30652/g.73520 Transcript_30652/m.73520 type:complete len:133 (+) Transcript_30652:85-483(+)